MVEGDNSSGETDKDGDIYHNYRVNYVYITFDGAQILAGSLARPPAHSSPICLFCLVFHFLAALPPHTPFSQYVAHSCFCLKTVLLINWRVCACNKNHDSRWTMHLLLPNFSNGTGCSLGLAARLHPPRDRATSEPVCRLAQALTLVYRCRAAVTFAILDKLLCTGGGDIVFRLH